MNLAKGIDKRYVMDLIRRDFDAINSHSRRSKMRRIISIAKRLEMPKADVQQMIDDYNSERSSNCKLESF